MQVRPRRRLPVVIGNGQDRDVQEGGLHALFPFQQQGVRPGHIYGDNGLRYDGIPEDLEDALLDCVIDEEVIHSVTFNDGGAIYNQAI